VGDYNFMKIDGCDFVTVQEISKTRIETHIYMDGMRENRALLWNECNGE
jgi:hypothetical protein